MTLFSGYESQMMALEVATNNRDITSELVGWSEISPVVQAVHNAAYPEYADRCYPDVTKIDWDTVGDIDILFASSPCQDVSRAGVRRGMKKGSMTRSSLVWEVEKAIAIKRPKWFVEENVEGMLDSIDDFEALVRSISSYGYVCFYRILKGSDFGIPQNRPRLFLVAVRIDEGEPYPTFQWPETTELKLMPEEFLSDYVDDKYYLTEVEKATFIDLMENACDGYTTGCTTGGASPERFYNRQFIRCVSRMVTPVCKSGAIPTFTTEVGCGGLEGITGCRMSHQPCVVEIWEGIPGLKPMITDGKAINRTIKTLRPCRDAKRVFGFISDIKENQYVRVRRLTPEECLRLMGVPEKHLRRMIHPYEQLSKEGYTEHQINELLHFKKSGRKFSDSTLYGRAGNSIIVDVIAAIFSEIIEQGDLNPEKDSRSDSKERRRITSRTYYERNKEEIRRKSREYHRERRRQLKLLKCLQQTA